MHVHDERCRLLVPSAAKRWLMSVPLLIVLGVVVNLVVATRRDPTTHNLWPFEVLAAIIGVGALLGVFEPMRLLVSRRGSAGPPQGWSAKGRVALCWNCCVVTPREPKIRTRCPPKTLPSIRIA